MEIGVAHLKTATNMIAEYLKKAMVMTVTYLKKNDGRQSLKFKMRSFNFKKVMVMNSRFRKTTTFKTTTFAMVMAQIAF